MLPIVLFMACNGRRAPVVVDVAVAGCVVVGVFVGLRGATMEGRDAVFKWPARVLLVSIGLQILLGFGALAAVMLRPEVGTTADVPAWEVLVTSMHQANGALLLITSGLLAAWYFRMPRNGSA